MKVKITSCKSNEYWYKDKIGETFEVNYPIQDCYKVWTGTNSVCILKTDCKIIE